MFSSPIRLTKVTTDNIQGWPECSEIDYAVQWWEENSVK